MLLVKSSLVQQVLLSGVLTLKEFVGNVDPGSARIGIVTVLGVLHFKVVVDCGFLSFLFLLQLSLSS